MGNFLNWVFNNNIDFSTKKQQVFSETEKLFDLPLRKDPAFTHVVTFDKAFADSDDVDDKDKWIQSVRDTAHRFQEQIRLILIQSEGVDNIFNPNLDGQTIIECCVYIRIVMEWLSRIANYHKGIDNIPSSYESNTGFGLNSSYVEKNYYDMKKILQKSLKPSVFKILEKITNWIITISKKGLEGKSEINRHIFKNYADNESHFANEIINLQDILLKFINKNKFSKYKDYLENLKSDLTHNYVLNNMQKIVDGDELIFKHKPLLRDLNNLIASLIYRRNLSVYVELLKENPEIHNLHLLIKQLKNLYTAIHYKLENN